MRTASPCAPPTRGRRRSTRRGRTWRRSAGRARRRGLAGTRSDSIAPARIRSTTTAVCTRSPRNFGNNTPRDTAPTWWPARPTRWSPDATDGGDSTWMTRSTAPMSMPSSSELVATTAGSRPALRSSSMSARCSLLTEPWWARASTAGAPDEAPDCAISWAGVRLPACREGGAAARHPAPRARLEPFVPDLVEPGGERSARRRELAKTRVERCDDTRSTIRSSTCGQIEAATLGTRGGAGQVAPMTSPRADMSAIGTTTSRSHSLSRAGARSRRGGHREEAGHLRHRLDRGGQPDPLGGFVEQRVEALEGEGEVGPALGAGDGVHLVEDHRLHARQRLAGLRGEDEEQRLRSRDEDVGGGAGERAPLTRQGCPRTAPRP